MRPGWGLLRVSTKHSAAQHGFFYLLLLPDKMLFDIGSRPRSAEPKDILRPHDMYGFYCYRSSRTKSPAASFVLLSAILELRRQPRLRNENKSANQNNMLTVRCMIPC